MPSTSADTDVELLGADARRETGRWVLSLTGALAKACGIDLGETPYIIYAAIVNKLDQEMILRTIREKRCTPETLAIDPPGDIDPEMLRILLAELLDSGAVYVDGHLRCAGDN